MTDAFETVRLVFFAPNLELRHIAVKAKHWLHKHLPQADTEIEPTKHYEEVENLVKTHASNPAAIILSVGGDGGYNLLINAVMRMQQKLTVGVIPAGNANDNATAGGWSKRHRREVLKALVAGRTRHQDVIKAEWSPDTGSRYALGYVGFGATGQAAEAMNLVPKKLRYQLPELLKLAYTHQSFRAIIDGREAELSSLSYHNIRRMGRFLNVSNNGSPFDGMMERVEVESKPKLLAKALGALGGLGKQAQLTEQTVMLLDSTFSQFDGEQIWLESPCQVVISNCPLALRTLARQ